MINSNGPPKVIQADVFTNREGETVNRLVLDVNGHDVQVLQYDQSPRVVVHVDQAVKQIDIRQAGGFIQARTKKEIYHHE